MELHAVHFKKDYDTLESALRRPDGVTILVYFFKVTYSNVRPKWNAQIHYFTIPARVSVKKKHT